MPLLPRPGSLLTRQFVPIIEKCSISVGADAIVDFGPVFLPAITGHSITQWSRTTPNPIGGKTIAVACFLLSQHTFEELAFQIEAMHSAAPFVLFADFKVAERNIELPASLLMRGVMGLGSSSQGCFKEYGGLEGLLYAERKRFAVRERHTLLGGSLSCILAESLH